MFDKVFCFLALLLAGNAFSASTVNWPQFRGPNRDSVWHETGILQTFPVEGLNVRWRVPIGAGNFDASEPESIKKLLRFEATALLTIPIEIYAAH